MCNFRLECCSVFYSFCPRCLERSIKWTQTPNGAETMPKYFNLCSSKASVPQEKANTVNTSAIERKVKIPANLNCIRLLSKIQWKILSKRGRKNWNEVFFSYHSRSTSPPCLAMAAFTRLAKCTASSPSCLRKIIHVVIGLCTFKMYSTTAQKGAQITTFPSCVFAPHLSRHGRKVPNAADDGPAAHHS